MKGERASKLSFGACRENVTASAVANARGIALGLLIFLKGRTEWNRGLRLLHCQIYTYYCKSEKGWMYSEVFAKCFENFCNDVKERPLLLIYDGHIDHVTILVITLAMKCYFG